MIHWWRSKEYPLAPVPSMVIFPDTIIGFSLTGERAIAAVEAAGENQPLVLVAQREAITAEPDIYDIYQVGTLGVVKQITTSETGREVLFEGRSRVMIKKFCQYEPYWRVGIDEWHEDNRLTDRVRARQEILLQQFKNLVNGGKEMSLEIIIKVLASRRPHELINLIAPQLNLPVELIQPVLEIKETEKRLDKTIELTTRELSLVKIKQDVENKTQRELTKAQREVYLREEIKTIQKELGDPKEADQYELYRQIISAGMPGEIRQKAEKEWKRLQQMPALSPEITYIRTYLDWLVNLPWDKRTPTLVDLSQAKEILEKEHYGLAPIKERILEYLAVQKLVGKTKGSILCFVGPPGTGKTSIAQSIAHALGRKFTKVSLGGIKDEAEIRGHRRTYVGAMPGRIIQGMSNAGSHNPVFLLDEVDKVGMDFRGDPSAALLEALDPEQNYLFSDHYLEVPFDLSETMFITTANNLETIPPPLLDRMEIVEFPGYSVEEKQAIARYHLLPRISQSHGLSEEKWQIADNALLAIINRFTREAGVRGLERELARIARKLAKQVVEGNNEQQLIMEDNVAQFLGPAKITPWIKNKQGKAGLTTAMAWTEAGGEILSVEVKILVNGQGQIYLTGHMGEVMKESAQTALAYARDYLNERGLEDKLGVNDDIHIHMPSGAVPKDGPSASLAMTVAIISAILGKPVSPEIAFSGEITLQGQLLRIGGVKEKILAAQRVGLKQVILPIENQPDTAEIVEETKQSVTLNFAQYADEVIAQVLG